jgi:hypothetical protein
MYYMKFRSKKQLDSAVCFRISERDRARLLQAAERPDIDRKPSELARLATLEYLDRLEHQQHPNNQGSNYHGQ